MSGHRARGAEKREGAGSLVVLDGAPRLRDEAARPRLGALKLGDVSDPREPPGRGTGEARHPVGRVSRIPGDSETGAHHVFGPAKGAETAPVGHGPQPGADEIE
jgi:hypothetical protein